MDICELKEKQKAYFLSGVTRPAEFRINALEKLADTVLKNEVLLSEALTKDLNRHPTESYMCETGIVLDEIRYHKKHLKSWMREKYVPTAVGQMPGRCFVSPEPYGVVLIMSPWNYPVQLCLEPLIGAISAGNCAIIKPSAYAPNTSAAIAKIIGETFDPKYIAVVEGGREENKALLEQEFDYIFFTGSVKVGKIVMEAAAKHLTPITLELGGKSPVIVDKTADISLAARRIAFGKVINAGQTCIEPDYLLIHKDVKEQFVVAYGKALDEFFPGGNYDSYAHIITDKHYNRVKGLLEGQKVLVGGGYNDETRFIEPTLLDETDPNSPIMQQEIFGPILPMITFTDINWCIDFIRRHPKPLAIYLFTKDKTIENKILNSCSFGGGCINDTILHIATHNMPFGGVQASGMGCYHGKQSFETFTHRRSILKSSNLIDPAIRYRPYTKLKDKLIHIVLK